jgi:hypothetical protein
MQPGILLEGEFQMGFRDAPLWKDMFQIVKQAYEKDGIRGVFAASALIVVIAVIGLVMALFQILGLAGFF